jgi:predicted RNase H-like HicB family nuclease
MSGYFAFIYPPEDGSSWGVTFPDLPGCASAGDSLEDAAVKAREALSGHLAALRADGDPIPPPRLWADISGDPETMADAAGAFVHYVVPRQISGERVRVNIMIDKGLLRMTDEAAEARGLSRSAFIESALTIAAEA